MKHGRENSPLGHANRPGAPRYIPETIWKGMITEYANEPSSTMTFENSFEKFKKERLKIKIEQ